MFISGVARPEWSKHKNHQRQRHGALILYTAANCMEWMDFKGDQFIVSDIYTEPL